MPKHYCLDPHDPYAEHEVLVEFQPTMGGLLLIAAIDDLGEDILSDLTEVQCDDLRRELGTALPSLIKPCGPADVPMMHAH